MECLGFARTTEDYMQKTGYNYWSIVQFFKEVDEKIDGGEGLWKDDRVFGFVDYGGSEVAELETRRHQQKLEVTVT